MSIMRRTVLLAVLVLVGGVQILFSNVVHIPGIQARKRVDPPMLVVHPQELAIDSPKFDPLDSPTCRTTYDDVMLKWVVLLREKEEQRFPFLQSVARGDLLKLSPTTTVNTLFGALRGNKTPVTARTHLYATVSAAFDKSMISHFIKHYKDQALLPENMHLLLQIDDTEEALESSRFYLREFSDVNTFCWYGNYSSAGMWQQMLALQASATIDDWIIHVDSDEFLHPPNGYDTLIHLIAAMEEGNYTHAIGSFSDRLAASCKTEEIVPDIPIETQFPCPFPGVEMIVPRNPVKASIRRGFMRSMRGNHCIPAASCPAGKEIVTGAAMHDHREFWTKFSGNLLNSTLLPGYGKIDVGVVQRKWPEKLELVHYKWHSGVLEKLEQRVQSYKQKGFSWWTESQKVIDYYNENNGFVMAGNCPC